MTLIVYMRSPIIKALSVLFAPVRLILVMLIESCLAIEAFSASLAGVLGARGCIVDRATRSDGSRGDHIERATRSIVDAYVAVWVVFDVHVAVIDDIGGRVAGGG